MSKLFALSSFLGGKKSGTPSSQSQLKSKPQSPLKASKQPPQSPVRKPNPNPSPVATPSSPTSAPPSTPADIQTLLTLRTVKISFPRDVERYPNEEELREALKCYGTIDHIGVKEKVAIVSFSSVQSALDCSNSVQFPLGPKYKVRYMGQKPPSSSVNVPPPPPPPSLSSPPPSLSSPPPPSVSSVPSQPRSPPILIQKPTNENKLNSSLHASFTAEVDGQEEVSNISIHNQTQVLDLEMNSSAVNTLGSQAVRMDDNVVSQSQSVPLDETDARDQKKQLSNATDGLGTTPSPGVWKVARSPHSPASATLSGKGGSSKSQPVDEQADHRQLTSLSLVLDDEFTNSREEETVKDEKGSNNIAKVSTDVESLSITTPMAKSIHDETPSKIIDPASPSSGVSVTKRASRTIEVSIKSVRKEENTVDMDSSKEENDGIIDAESEKMEVEIPMSGPVITVTKTTFIKDDLKTSSSPSSKSTSPIAPKSSLTIASIGAGSVEIDNTQGSKSLPPSPVITQTKPEEGTIVEPPYRDMYFALLSEVKLLRAEARVRARERAEYEEEAKRCEENWATELSALSIRNASLEAEVAGYRESIRKLKMNMASKEVEVAAAIASCNAAEYMNDTAKIQAEREALSAILAQRQLFEVLEKQKGVLETQVESMMAEISNLRSEHQKSVEEAIKWKSTAHALEQQVTTLKSLNKQNMIASTSEDIDNGEENRKKSETDAAISSSRRLYEKEVDSYLNRVSPTSLRIEEAALKSTHSQPLEQKNKNNFNVSCVSHQFHIFHSYIYTTYSLTFPFISFFSYLSIIQSRHSVVTSLEAELAASRRRLEMIRVNSLIRKYPPWRPGGKE